MQHLKRIEQLVHKKIPISKDMGISLSKYDAEGLVVKAPLHKNINHKQTVFGGSLNAVATLSGWIFLYLMLDGFESPAHIVIQKSSIRYLKPVPNDFEAICEWPDHKELVSFQKMYQKKRRARIELHSKILVNGEPAVLFDGVFVAMPC